MSELQMLENLVEKMKHQKATFEIDGFVLKGRIATIDHYRDSLEKIIDEIKEGKK